LNRRLKLLTDKLTYRSLWLFAKRLMLRALLFIATGGLTFARCIIGRKYVLLVGCHDREFSNNALAVCLIGKTMKKWAIFAVCNKDCGDRLKAMGIRYLVKGSLRCRAYARIADFVASTGYVRGDIGNLRELNKRSIRVLLWHGMPLKGVGLQCPPVPDDVSGYDYTIATSSFTAAIMSKAFGLCRRRVIVSGEPKADVVRWWRRGTEQASFWRAKLLSGRSRLVVYAPTWREVPSVSCPDVNEPDHDWMSEVLTALTENMALKEYCVKSDTRLMLKLHPYHRDLKCSVAEPFGLLSGAEIPAEGIIGIADAIITDYSSIVFDVLAAEIPFILFVPDIARYKRVRPFPYFEFEAMFSPWCCEDTERLVSMLERLSMCPNDERGDLERLSEVLVETRNGDATAALLNYLQAGGLTRVSEQ
jgi:CDP-glycerol glycerophosphotransferase (TagB/SpsB family)